MAWKLCYVGLGFRMLLTELKLTFHHTAFSSLTSFIMAHFHIFFHSLFHSIKFGEWVTHTKECSVIRTVKRLWTEDGGDLRIVTAWGPERASLRKCPKGNERHPSDTDSPVDTMLREAAEPRLGSRKGSNRPCGFHSSKRCWLCKQERKGAFLSWVRATADVWSIPEASGNESDGKSEAPQLDRVRTSLSGDSYWNFISHTMMFSLLRCLSPREEEAEKPEDLQGSAWDRAVNRPRILSLWVHIAFLFCEKLHSNLFWLLHGWQNYYSSHCLLTGYF